MKRFASLFAVAAVATASICDGSPPNSEALKPQYDAFVASLDYRQLVEDYPGALRNLDSTDPEKQIVGIKTLAATDELKAIPWIVPMLDSKDGRVRIYAGQALGALVASHELKRRDKTRPDQVVIRPRGPEDVDLRPMSWVIRKMLRMPDDGNTHAYAANMIGYLGLREYEEDLRQLLKSRHPAVSQAARRALQMIDADVGEGTS